MSFMRKWNHKSAIKKKQILAKVEEKKVRVYVNIALKTTPFPCFSALIYCYFALITKKNINIIFKWTVVKQKSKNSNLNFSIALQLPQCVAAFLV